MADFSLSDEGILSYIPEKQNEEDDIQLDRERKCSFLILRKGPKIITISCESMVTVEEAEL